MVNSVSVREFVNSSFELYDYFYNQKEDNNGGVIHPSFETIAILTKNLLSEEELKTCLRVMNENNLVISLVREDFSLIEVTFPQNFELKFFDYVIPIKDSQSAKKVSEKELSKQIKQLIQLSK